jgi:hypothetical protein
MLPRGASPRLGSAGRERVPRFMWRRRRDCDRRCSLFVLAFAALLSALAAWPLPTQAKLELPAPQPDWSTYTIQLPAPPADGGAAIATTKLRANRMIQYYVCGWENKFLALALDPSAGAGNTGAMFIDDAILYPIIAKLLWLKQGLGDCTGTFNVPYQMGAIGDFFNDSRFTTLEDFIRVMGNTFGSPCATSTFDVRAPAVFPPSPTPFTTVTSRMSADCLRAQIAFVLSQMLQGNFQPGSSDVPCGLNPDSNSFTNGDWDMRMKTLIRILYIDAATFGDNVSPSILAGLPPPDAHPEDQSLRGYIENHLISLETEVGTDSYSVLGCGDNERDTDSSQDREDSANSDGDVLDTVGDVGNWFIKFLVHLILSLTAGGLVGAVAGLAGGGTAVILGALGAAAVAVGQIPETENHRLMIESTRFLKNQLVIKDLHGNAPGVDKAQADVKTWLLNRFQELAKHEFIEYNSRPYHGFALGALRNLADFSDDADVRIGAQMLLDFSAAKFAVGSDQGRRLAPFRRHFDVVNCLDGVPCPDNPDDQDNSTPAEIFRGFAHGLGDSEVALGLLFNGQTQQLPFGSMSVEALGEAFPAATSQLLPSGYVPHVLTADLAIDKEFPYFQRIHHDGYEVYSGSQNVLITAGGVRTDHAYHFTIFGVPVPKLFTKIQDFGSGLPTTVMFTGDSVGPMDKGALSKMRLDAFISFRGTRETETEKSDNVTFTEETFNHNLCVWRNFACGTDLRIPHDIFACLDKTTVGFYFFDSSTCDGYKNGPSRFFVALFAVCTPDCLASANSNANDPGFTPEFTGGLLEVVDAPTISFEAFKQQVIKANSAPANPDNPQSCLGQADCKAAYLTWGGHRLELEFQGNQHDSDKSGISSVDGVSEEGLGDVNLAEGDSSAGVPPPISSQGDGIITIIYPRTGAKTILNFSDVDHPCRGLVCP